MTQTIPVQSTTTNINPLLTNWEKTQPYGLPPFSLIKAEHFKPALLFSMKLHLEEIQQIADNKNDPTFENTIESLDQAGGLFSSIGSVFHNLCSSNTSPELQTIQLDLSSILAAHDSKIYTYPGLFPRIETIFNNRHTLSPALNPEQIRLVERFHLDFVRMGAKFDITKQQRYSAIMEELATLQTQFAQNVLKDESEVTVSLKRSDLDGCPSDLIASLKQVALDNKKTTDIPAVHHEKNGNHDEDDEDAYMITLSRSLIEPFLTFCSHRPSREKVFQTWSQRGELDLIHRNNNQIAVHILKLRLEQASLHGYKNFAEFQTFDSMAQTPKAVMDLLERVWSPAKDCVLREQAELEAYMKQQAASSIKNGYDGNNGNNQQIVGNKRDENGDLKSTTTTTATTSCHSSVDSDMKLEAWDWRHYAEKVRIQKYDFDETSLKPYLSLPTMQAAVFDLAYRLFGLIFVLRDDIVSYHPDVQTFEVYEEVVGTRGKSKKLIAIFLHDNYARKNKQSGAWMSEYRSQTKNSNQYIFHHHQEGGGEGSVDTTILQSGEIEIKINNEHILPIVVNNNNFARSGDDTVPTLLSFDDCITLFHEFGHGLHGMLSNVQFTRLASTNVLRDFVELPSQLMEHWLRSTNEILKLHAKHYLTNEPISEELLKKLKIARNFNTGFATMEYTICALMDQLLHDQLSLAELNDVQNSCSNNSNNNTTTPASEHDFDLKAYEAKTLKKLGMPSSIIMRHRLPHFQHLFASSGYASAYYVYLYAEVLDADAFEAFLESPGANVFDKDTADRVRAHIYSTGNSVEPGETYRRFRGRNPDINAMLKKKGLL